MAFFFSGSSAATAAAIGSMLIPEMEKQKYPRPFSAATTASSGELGVIIPPSVNNEDAKAKFGEFETVLPYLRKTKAPG